MKKTVLHITAALFLALILSSCSQLLSDAAKETEGPTAPVYTGDETQPTGADAPSEAPSDEPTEPEKPVSTGYDQYGFTVWPEGNYLADPKFDTEEFLPDFDADVSFIQYVSTAKFAVSVTEDTIYAFPYYFTDSPNNPVIRYTDRATGITLPLCGKPECTHSDSSCNAYVSGHNAMAFRVYDGKLWWVQYEPAPTLKRMGLDATDRETVMSLDPVPLTKLTGDSVWVLHRGYLYIGGQNSNMVIDGETGGSFTVYARPIDGGDSFTILSRVIVGCNDAHLSMKPVGNDLYISLNYYFKDSDDKPVYCYELYRWDSKTRKAECLFSAQNGEYSFERMMFPLPVPGDGMYYVNSRDIRYEVDSWLSEFTIFKYSFESGEMEQYSSPFDVENGVAAGLTREHFMVRTVSEEIRVYIYDHMGSLISVSEPLNDHYGDAILLMGEDDEYVYFESLVGRGKPSCILALPIDGGDYLVIER